MSDKQFTLCVAFFPQNTVPAPFLVKTDTFHNQVADVSVNFVGRDSSHALAHSGGNRLQTQPSLGRYVRMLSVVMAGSNYTSHIYESLLPV